MSQSSSAPFLVGDIVSYKYNGMRGEIASVEGNSTLVVRFPSQNRTGDVITVTLSVKEVELIAGKTLVNA